MSCVKNEKISPYRLYNEAQNCNYILGDCATSRGDAWLWEIGEPVFVLTGLFSSFAMWIFWGRVQEALGWNFDQELVCATHLTVHLRILDYQNKKSPACICCTCETWIITTRRRTLRNLDTKAIILASQIIQCNGFQILSQLLINVSFS